MAKKEYTFTWADNIVQFILMFIIGVLSAVKGIGWNFTTETGMWWNPVLYPSVYLWIWGGQSIALTADLAYVIIFIGFSVLLWWFFLAFLIMKIADILLPQMKYKSGLNKY